MCSLGGRNKSRDTRTNEKFYDYDYAVMDVLKRVFFPIVGEFVRSSSEPRVSKRATLNLGRRSRLWSLIEFIGSFFLQFLLAKGFRRKVY